VDGAKCGEDRLFIERWILWMVDIMMFQRILMCIVTLVFHEKTEFFKYLKLLDFFIKMNSSVNKTPQTPLLASASKCPFVSNSRPIELKNYLDDSSFTDSLYSRSKTKIRCNEQRCLGSFINPSSFKFVPKSKEEMIEQAKDFIKQFYASAKMSNLVLFILKFTKS
jgi:hypothetical protein